jgi:MFS family permease
VGFAAISGFIVLMLESRGIENATFAFVAFAATVVGVRLIGGNLPDRFGGARCAAVAGLVEAAGLATIAVAQSLPVAMLGAFAMGGAFALLLPSLALLALEDVPIERRGATMGTLTAFFDLGVGVGAPLAGAVAAIAGYGAAFWLSAIFALALAALAIRAGQKQVAIAPSPG